MAKQSISIGSSANDGTGTSLRDGGDLINDNFNEIYTKLGDGSTLTSAISATATTLTLSNTSFSSFQIKDTSADHTYNFTVKELTANRNVELPLLGADDVFVFEAHSQTLTNKTLTTPTLTTPIATAGVQLKNGATSAGFLEFFEDSDNGTNKVTLIGPASTADVTLTLPSATDTLVGKATTDTLTNKSIDLANNTVTGSLAEFNTALQSDSFVSLTGSESLSNKTLTAPVVTSPTYTWTTKTNSDSPYTATAGDFLFINTSSGAVTVTLPSSASVGHTIKFKDLASSFATNNLTVGRNSHKIEGSASDLTVNNNGAGFTLVYSGATYGWLIQDV